MASAAGGGGGANVSSVAFRGIKEPIPGFSANGKRITDPTAFLESVLEGFDGVKALFDGAAGGGEAPMFIKDLKTTGNIFDKPLKNPINKVFQDIPYIGMMRNSASRTNNCCFFDSFLTCMSPKYRKLSIANREIVFILFRRWCNENSEKIINSGNETMLKILSLSLGKGIVTTNSNGENEVLEEAEPTMEEDFKTENNAIGLPTGWIIGWFFGVNVIFMYQNEYPGKNVNMSYPHYLIHCPSAYQSPECKTIIIRQGKGHFESIGVIDLINKKLNEANSTFVFEWTDPRLCALKTFALNACEESDKDSLYKKWDFPAGCSDDDPVVAAALQELKIQNVGDSENAARLKKEIAARAAAGATAAGGNGINNDPALAAAIKASLTNGGAGGGGGGAAAGGTYGGSGGARKTRKYKKRKQNRRNHRTHKKSKKTRRQ